MALDRQMDQQNVSLYKATCRGILPVTHTWVKLKDTMLREINQSRRTNQDATHMQALD